MREPVKGNESPWETLWKTAVGDSARDPVQGVLEECWEKEERKLVRTKTA